MGSSSIVVKEQADGQTRVVADWDQAVGVVQEQAKCQTWVVVGTDGSRKDNSKALVGKAQ